MAQHRSNMWRAFHTELLENWFKRWERQFIHPKLPSFNFWWLLVLAGIVYSTVKRRRWLIFLAWVSLYVVGYAVLGVAGYPWYQLPIQFALYIFTALGLISIADVVAKKGGFRIPRALVSAAFMIVVCYLLIGPRIRGVRH